jgi:hypothetical protein
MSAGRGAWIRYGDPVTEDQIAFAAGHYRVAILQPWETDTLAQLKAAAPDMTVLQYKCLSSTRSYEQGPVFSSGVDFEEAEEAGEHWFAHRLDGSRIGWTHYAGHWQMAVWEPEYQERWCDNVADDLEDTLWDGVMADNDVFDDYYGLRPPLEGDRAMADIRAALDGLVAQAGQRLNRMDKILVPNIAESRRETGRWARHAAFGGGFEEVFLAWGPEDYLDPVAAVAQAQQIAGPGLTIFRTASDGTPGHRNFTYGLAAFWVFGGASGGAFTATAHDSYSVTPFIPQLAWDLGRPLEDPRQRGNGWSREFDGGWAAVNLNNRRRRQIAYEPPPGLMGPDGKPSPRRLVLQPHEGVVLRRPDSPVPERARPDESPAEERPART